MPDRFYLATFDLVNSRGREAEYARARAALEFLVGSANYHRPVKQCCIIGTDKSINAGRIKDTLRQTLGSNSNILVVRLRHGYATALIQPANRARTRTVLGSIPPD